LEPLPVFSWDIFREVSGDPEIWALENFHAVNARFLEDLKQIPADNFSPDDLVYFPNLLQNQMQGIALWLGGLPESRRPAVAVMLRYLNHAMEYIQARAHVDLIPLLYRFAARSLLAVQPRSRICADTRELAEAYQKITGLPVLELPNPMDVSALIHAQASSKANERPVVLFQGHTSPLRGFHFLPDIIERCAGLDPKPLFVIQVQNRDMALQTGMGEVLTRLERMAGADVRLVEGALDSDAYFALLAEADLVLLPYSPRFYGVGSSGVFTEAASAGKVIVVSAGTVAARQGKEFGLGVVLADSWDADSMARAVFKALENIDSLRKTAVAGAGSFRADQCAEGLWNILLPALAIAPPDKSGPSDPTNHSISEEPAAGHPTSGELAVQNTNSLSRTGEMQKEFANYRKALEESTGADEDLPTFSEEEIANFEAIIGGYQSDPANVSTQEQLRSLRQGIASFLVNARNGQLALVMGSSFGKAYRLLLASGFQDEGLSAAEAGVPELLYMGFNDKGEFGLQRLMAFMLFCRAHQSEALLAFELIPSWFLKDYLQYLLHAPNLFFEIGEAERFRRHFSSVTKEIERRIVANPDENLTLEAASHYVERANLIPLYFTPEVTRKILEARARIMGFVFSKHGAVLDFHPKKSPAGRKKIKVGVLSAHFTPQTETYTVIPLFAHLDRSAFEITLFAVESATSPLESYCRDHADHFVALPKLLHEQVALIRKAGMEVLFFGTNVTAVTNQVSLLALHRMAPIQIMSNSSPVSSGMPFMDAYLSGSFCEMAAESASEQFSEKLLLLDGPAHCVAYAVDAVPAQITINRGLLGIPEEAVVFVSGANCYKIIPELQETWAKILAAVPGSYLLLHPFNPNWSNQYPVKLFERSIHAAMRCQGVAPGRLILSSEKLPTRSDVKELMRVADIYLDSFPFAGVNSTVDPLELGIPPLAWEGKTFRSRMAASLLRELAIPELITETEEDYITVAARLGNDATFRREIAGRVRTAMAAQPAFLNMKQYGEQVGNLLHHIAREGIGDDRNPVRPKTRNAQHKPTPTIDPAEHSPEKVLQLARDAFGAGRWEQTEDLCRHLLTRAPETATAWALLAELSRRSGDLDYAAELMDQALELDPDNADFWSTLGEIRRDKKDLDGALAAFQCAVGLRPDFPNAWLMLALVQDERKEAAEAEKAYTEALCHSGDQVETAQIRVNFAGFLRDQKRIKEGIKQLRKAVSSVPDSSETLLLLGSFLQEGGDLDDAMSTFARATKKFPDSGRSWLEWGKTLLLLGRREEAVEKLRKAAACQPDDPDILFNLGYSLQQNVQRKEALQVYLDAERAGGDTLDLHLNIGVIFKDQERYMEAAQRFHKAFERNPESHAAMNNLGAVCIHLGLTTEAIECFQHALRLNPTMSAPHNNLGHMLKISGKAAEGLVYYLKGLKLDPGNKEMMHNYLLSTLYQANFSPQDIFEEHHTWGMRLSAGIKRLPRRHVREGHPEGKIRIGYVSPDLCMHPVSFFAGALMGGYDRERFEVYVFSDVRKPDAVTERFRSLVDVWRDIGEMQNQEAGELMQQDEIDILVDLCGHTAHNRLEVLAAKPAPITVSYLGYPATIGMSGIDFRITDVVADPPGETDAWHTEKLVRLERCAWCFEPPATSPPVSPLPADKNGFITFGCFNNLAKLNAPLYDWWVEILRQVPDSRLFLKAKTLIDPGICQEVRDYFTTRGIAPDRLRVSGFENSTKSHLDRYNEVDIALDSYPYHGTTTTCEALWMGVPVITRAGEAHLSRVGVSLLQAVGHPELVASSTEGFIRLAVELAQDPARLRTLRAGLRGQMQASPLLDQAGFIRALEEAFSSLVSRRSELLPG
jgi:predicted O-linked N-acetylglucosamine transferase (SPINDLY family)/glycosyltransferase involved in cell wall biosynthesis